MHKKRYWIGLALALVMFLSSGAPAGQVYATSLEEQRDQALDKIDDIKADIKTVKSKIQNLKNSKSDLQSYINELDEQATQLAQQQVELEEDIEETEEELEEAIETVDKQYEAMKLRIQYMYENGNYSYMVMLLESSSMKELLNRAEFANQMVEYDRRMLVSFQAAKRVVENTKKKLEEQQKELEEQQEALDLLIETKTAEIAEYQRKIDAAQDDADDYAAQLKKQETLLNQIEDQIALEAALNDIGGSGVSGFVWPVPASKRITSYFGPRKQPTAGASTNHKGIDIGAASGTAIIASAGGVVTTSTYSKSAGNYIVISHGGGMSTVYMHCSKLYVGVGATVKQGQTIAAVGSTGYSTGPHLHFGVIKNGTYVNPLGYVK